MDPHVRRGAFGYNEAADRIAADYYQQGLLQLQDGTHHQFTVKRAHDDLENYVEDAVDSQHHEQEHQAALATRHQQAQRLVRRWARGAA